MTAGPVLRVDLDALAANIAVAGERIAPAQLMLVVKDDAYGHGVEAVVGRAWMSGVRWFGAFDVATAERVRAVLGDEPRVFVWIAAGHDELARAAALRLDVGVGDAELLEELAEVAAAAGTPARVHLKIDSGLHRNGVRPEQWEPFVARAAARQASGAIEVVGVWSHLAEASDDEDERSRAVFESAIDRARAHGLRPAVRHLAASAAAFARAPFRYDLCRVGAFCYGIRPAHGPDESVLGVSPVATLDAAVVDVSEAEVVVDVGALHGIPSGVAGRISVRTPAGNRTVRRVEDHRMLVEPWPAALGDRVAVWGGAAAMTATDLAETVDTIGEEIAVRVSPRVARDYG